MFTAGAVQAGGSADPCDATQGFEPQGTAGDDQGARGGMPLLPHPPRSVGGSARGACPLAPLAERTALSPDGGGGPTGKWRFANGRFTNQGAGGEAEGATSLPG